MAYVVIALKDLTELKSRRGNSTNTAMATILGATYPLVEAYTVYVWDDTSIATPDDDEIVQPTIGGITTGRWYKVDLDSNPQINSDWNATTGAAFIVNKPTLFSGVYNDLTSKPALFDGDYLSLSNKPTIPTDNTELTNGNGYISSVPAQSFTSLTGKPTNLAGYGIIDAYPLTGNPSGFLTSSPVTSGDGEAAGNRGI